MALSKVEFTRAQGNMASPILGEDHISALLFDVTTFPGTAADGDMWMLTDLNDAESIGVTAFDGTSGATNYEFGVPHLHISDFFRLNPGGILYVSFADCSTDWDIIDQMQRMAQGKIRQLGVWTRSKLLTAGATTTDPYTVNLTTDMHNKAKALADVNQPVSILLSANMASIDAAGDTTKLELLPTLIGSNSRVTALIGQGNSATVKAIQTADTNHATVGYVGVALALVAKSTVGESIAWVGKFDCSGGDMDTVAMGFGDVSIVAENIVNLYPIEAIAPAQLDIISDKGYVFPIKLTGRAGTFISSSKTCSDGDYRRIELNRAIDKSRRNLRAALLPFLNSPVDLNISTGKMSIAQIKVYEAVCSNILTAMQTDDEISGFQINIDQNQNVAIDDTLRITYVLIAKGIATQIKVTEGFALKTT